MTRTVRGLTVAMGLLAVLALGSPAFAALMMDFSGGTAADATTTTGTAGASTLGFSFTVSSPITVGALGMWDEGADGLAAFHIAGLWRSDGTQLATTVLTPSSNGVASSSGFGQWVFEDIAPLVLNAGAYVVGVIYLDGDPDPVRVSATATTIPEVAFGTTLFAESGELAFPINALSEFDDVMSANLLTVTAVVPAPPALLTVAFTVASLGAVRVWRRWSLSSRRLS